MSAIIRVLFALFLVCAFGYGIYESTGYMKLAKYFPLYVSSFCLVFSLIQLALEVKVARGAIVKKGSQKVDLSTDWEIPLNQVIGKAIFYFMYIVIFYALIVLVGLRIAAVIGLFLVFRYQNKYENWRAIVVSLCGWVFMVAISKILAVRVPYGLLHDFVALPKQFF